MAKQISILVISLLILIVGGLWEVNYLERTAYYLMGDVDSVKNAIENNNFDVAQSNLKNVEHTWEKMRFTWNIFVNHERIDSLENDMNDIKSYIEAKNTEDSVIATKTLNKTIFEIVDKQKFSFEHVI
ncbi:MAG: DUF4363 family protein [Clostridia bacterium]|nr:DUF4363 family protein [Clostridia bacterium]